MRIRRACMRLASAGVVHYHLRDGKIGLPWRQRAIPDAMGNGYKRQFAMAILDSNQGPLPYQ
jgi:hypothetical protein